MQDDFAKRPCGMPPCSECPLPGGKSETDGRPSIRDNLLFAEAAEEQLYKSMCKLEIIANLWNGILPNEGREAFGKVLAMTQGFLAGWDAAIDALDKGVLGHD